MNVQPSYTALNVQEGGADEVAGVPVPAFIGIIVGALCCLVLTGCLLRYIFCPRKFQTPDMEMENMSQEGGMSPHQQVDHQNGPNDIFASNTSFDNNQGYKQNQEFA